MLAKPIEIKRREALEIEVKLTSIALTENDKIVFSIRTGTAEQFSYVYKKVLTANNLSFVLESKDTAIFEQGRYYYDFWLILADGESVPMCEPTEFWVSGAVYKGA